MNILPTQKCGSKPLNMKQINCHNCNGKWCRMFKKLGEQEHLNKRKIVNELSHMKLERSMMIGTMQMNLGKNY
jgi:hypothetical protein